ncbi:MAG TPA: hypothetical protein VHK47_15080 [Polyangia bacterium]|nr:hypothetical protein [Polyangia bacterium]
MSLLLAGNLTAGIQTTDRLSSSEESYSGELFFLSWADITDESAGFASVAMRQADRVGAAGGP